MIARLTKRRDFLAAAKGFRSARRAFVLEALKRGDENVPRFGFTVSKRTAKKAVERNRIRRRLKEAVRLDAPLLARPGHDYVLIGRTRMLGEAFTDVRRALAEALARAHDFRAAGHEAAPGAQNETPRRAKRGAK